MGILMYNGNPVGQTIVNNIITVNGLSGDELGTANPSNVLTGVTFTSKDGVCLEGTMLDNGALVLEPTDNGRITIPEGYHNGEGYVDTSLIYKSGLTSTTLVNNIQDVDGDFIPSGTSGTRWSWVNTLGDCKIMVYMGVSKTNWDGSSYMYMYVDNKKVLEHDIYSIDGNNIDFKLGQTLKINVSNTNTKITDCIIVLYAFS